MMLPMTSTPDMGGAAGGRAAERAVVSSGCLISRCLSAKHRGLVPWYLVARGWWYKPQANWLCCVRVSVWGLNSELSLVVARLSPVVGLNSNLGKSN